MSANTYRGLHAAHYDRIYAEKPYADEARLVHGLLVDRGVRLGRLLDVACGTGRHAREFARLGWEVTGVDYAPELLAAARADVPEATFVEQDMRGLDVPGPPFDAVTCLFDSVGYPLSDEGVLAALSGLARHVAPDGIVVIEFLQRSALERQAAPVRVRRWPLPDGGTLLRVSETQLDPAGVMTVDYEVLELVEDGTYERWTERQRNRSFERDEMQDLLAAAALVAEPFLPAYDLALPVAEAVHLLAVVRPAA